MLGDGAKWGKARGSGSLGGIWGLRAPYGDGAWRNFGAVPGEPGINVGLGVLAGRGPCVHHEPQGLAQAKTKGNNVNLGVKYAEKQQRRFHPEKLREGRNIIGLQVPQGHVGGGGGGYKDMG